MVSYDSEICDNQKQNKWSLEILTFDVDTWSIFLHIVAATRTVDGDCENDGRCDITGGTPGTCDGAPGWMGDTCADGELYFYSHLYE